VYRAAAVPVEVVRGARAIPVEVHHDWVDVLAAVAGIAGIVGALVAIIALVIARGAAADAKVQREVAEAQRKELNRRAVPVAELDVSAAQPADPSVRWVVLVLGLHNEGDRAAQRVHLNFLIPRPLVWKRIDQFGNDNPEGKIAATPERLGDHDKGAQYWDIDVGWLVPHGGMHRVLYMRLINPAAGTYVLKAAVMNDDLPGGVQAHYWRLTVPDIGGPPASVEPIEPPS